MVLDRKQRQQCKSEYTNEEVVAFLQQILLFVSPFLAFRHQ